jgi:DNA (cytosine-5)-methyltransferase 1
MRYLSLYSGIEAASVAWVPLGFAPVAFAEIDPFACALLAHHYPEVPNLGDATTIHSEPGSADLVVGGSPCQSFSVAGKRLGLDDPRGHLALEYLRIIRESRARWMVYENVPGLLSSANGDDFAAFLSAATGWDIDAPADGWKNSGIVPARSGTHHGVAWRILDAQYFGVPQRRRRVFIVGYLGDWRRAAAVLLERHSLSGNSPPRREAGAKPTRCLEGGTRGGGGQSGSDGQETLIPCAYGDNNTTGPIDVATACNAHGGPHGRLDFESETFIAHTPRADGFDASEDGTGRGTPLVPVPFIVNAAESCAVQSHARPSETARCLDSTGSFANAQGGTVIMQPYNIIGCGQQGKNHAYESDVSGCLQHKGLAATGNEAGTLILQEQPAIAFAWQGGGNQTTLGFDAESQTVPTLGVKQTPAVTHQAGVRRLTPLECERLQGFPDDFTLVPFRGKPAADGNRYKALGNSIAVPVLRWIGQRIALVEKIT